MSAEDHLGPQWKNPMPGPGSRVDWLSTQAAWRHREHDRSVPGWLDRGEPGSYQKLLDDIRGNGIREPLKLAYDPARHEAMFEEGNHRLQAAVDLGHRGVPVEMTRRTAADDRWNAAAWRRPVQGEQKTTEKPGDRTRPRDVLGPGYRPDYSAMKIGRELHPLD